MLIHTHLFRPAFLAVPLAIILTACSSGGTTKTRVCKNLLSNQYCVQSGDTLTRISQRYRVSINDLKTWNNLRSDNIKVGQALIVRGNKTTASNNAIRSNNNITLQMPVQGTIISSYSKQNKGLDIAAPRGTLVHAAADGTVIYADQGVRGYGKLLLIRHSPTTITAYAHNDNFLVANKSTVRAGQIIATVGDSGRRDGRTALHFELRINGKHVNPAAYLR